MAALGNGHEKKRNRKQWRASPWQSRPTRTKTRKTSTRICRPAGTQVVDPAHDVSLATPARSAWNFDYVVSTALGGSTTTLDAFTFKLAVTQNGTNTHIFEPQPEHARLDRREQSIGRFRGRRLQSSASAQVQSQVAEN